MKKLSTDSLTYSIGFVINSALGLVFYILIARALGPAVFGIASVIIAISTVASDVFDFGMNTSMLKFLAESPKEDRAHLSRDFFSYKLISVGIVLILALIFGQAISVVLFKTSNYTIAVWFGLAASAATIFYGYVNANLQANKRFASSVFLNLFSNSLRLVITGFLFINLRIDLNSTLFAFFVPTVCVAVIWAVLDKEITIRVNFSKKILGPVINYGKWVAGSMALASVTSRLDNILLVNLASAFETGIYTSVQRIFFSFNMIPAAISTVIAPDLSSKEDSKISQAFKFGVGFSCLTVIGLFVFIILAPVAVPLVFGQNYIRSVIPSQILAVGTMFFALAMPINAYILYTKQKSNRTFLITLVQLAATIGLNLLLIPMLGAIGAAASYACVSLLGLIVTVVLFFK